MSDCDFTLGLVPLILSVLLLLIIMFAAAFSAYKPPRKRILAWPYAFLLTYIACAGPLKVLLSGCHSYTQEILESFVVAVSIVVAAIVICRPNGPLFIALSSWLAFSLTRYVLAFKSACHDCAVVDVLPLLRHPFWINTLVGQLAALLAAATLAWLAVWRRDVFEKT